jgi:hypothetical protein
MHWDRVATSEGGLDVLFASPHHLLPHGVSSALLVQESHSVFARELVPDPGSNLGQVRDGNFGIDSFARFSIGHSGTLTFGNIDTLVH